MDGAPLPLAQDSSSSSFVNGLPPSTAPPPGAAPLPAAVHTTSVWLHSMGGLDTVTVGGWYDISANMRGHHIGGMTIWKLEVAGDDSSSGTALTAAQRCSQLVVHAADWVTLTKLVSPAHFGPVAQWEPYLGTQVDSTTGSIMPGKSLVMMHAGVDGSAVSQAYVADLVITRPSVSPAEAGLDRQGQRRLSCTAGVDPAALTAGQPVKPWNCTGWSPMAGLKSYCLEAREQQLQQAAGQQQAGLQASPSPQSPAPEGQQAVQQAQVSAINCPGWTGPMHWLHVHIGRS